MFRPLATLPLFGQIVTFSVFHYAPTDRFWALAQMGMAPPLLRKVPGLSFAKMMGSGRGGFGVLPDWGRYALLGVWETDAAADAFFGSPQLDTFRRRAAEIWSVKMLPLRTHGQWDGVEPFKPQPVVPPPGLPVAVLTRASIRTGALVDFWRHVPQASRNLYGSEALLYSVGVGEKPLVQQATVSFWRDAAALEGFAYRQSGHKEIVRRTRERNWYSEELFARFLPIATEGTCGGKDLLAQYGPAGHQTPPKELAG
jgi:heme-degrading monooxygenase HmoA